MELSLRSLGLTRYESVGCDGENFSSPEECASAPRPLALSRVITISIYLHLTPSRNHLTAQVTRHVGDMYPSSVALPDELRKLNAPLLLHLHDEAEQTAVVGSATRNDVRRTAEDMVAVLHPSDERVELLAAIPATHHDRLSPRFAYRV